MTDWITAKLRSDRSRVERVRITALDRDYDHDPRSRALERLARKCGGDGWSPGTELAPGYWMREVTTWIPSANAHSVGKSWLIVEDVSS